MRNSLFSNAVLVLMILFSTVAVGAQVLPALAPPPPLPTLPPPRTAIAAATSAARTATAFAPTATAIVAPMTANPNELWPTLPPVFP